MDTKKLYFMLAIGVVAGLAIGFPLARLAQPVKTVTKTVTKPVVQKLQNGEPLSQVLAGLGTALGVVQHGSAANSYITCIAYRGPAGDTTTTALKPGDWFVKVCAKTQ